MPQSLVVYVDVDDTLIRSASQARIPMPEAIAAVRRLYESGAELYCWSSGGAAYARESAVECGLADCFLAFLPKPHVMLDDVPFSRWRRLRHVHPNDAANLKGDINAPRPDRREAGRGAEE